MTYNIKIVQALMNCIACMRFSIKMFIDIQLQLNIMNFLYKIR